MPRAEAPRSKGIGDVGDQSALIRTYRGHGLGHGVRPTHSTRSHAGQPFSQEALPARTRDAIVHFRARCADGHLLQHKASISLSLATCTDRAGAPANVDELRHVLARIGTEVLALGTSLEAESLRIECLWPVAGGSADVHAELWGEADDVEILLVTTGTPMAAVLDAPVLRVTANLPPNRRCEPRARLQSMHLRGDQLTPPRDLAHPSAEFLMEHAAASAPHLDTAAGLAVCPAFFEHRATFQALTAANAPSPKPHPRPEAARCRDAEPHSPLMQGSSHALPLPSPLAPPSSSSQTLPLPLPLAPPSSHALHMAIASHESAAAQSDANKMDDTTRKQRPLVWPPPMEGGAQKSETMAKLAQLGCDAATARQLLLLDTVNRHPAP
jgi:hypothetical protein